MLVCNFAGSPRETRSYAAMRASRACTRAVIHASISDRSQPTAQPLSGIDCGNVPAAIMRYSVARLRPVLRVTSAMRRIASRVVVVVLSTLLLRIVGTAKRQPCAVASGSVWCACVVKVRATCALPYQERSSYVIGSERFTCWKLAAFGRRLIVELVRPVR